MRNAAIQILASLLLLHLAGCGARQRPTDGYSFPQKTGELRLEISGFRNNKGQALTYIYAGKDGFPDHQSPGLKVLRSAIQQRQVELVLPKLPYGAYAISVLHDENSNDRMDKGLLGQPREGFGFSLNPSGLFGPPEYAQTRFLFLYPEMRQRIEVHYQTYRQEHRRQRRNKVSGG